VKADVGDAGAAGALDDATRMLVQLAAVLTSGTEPEIREACARAVGVVPAEWAEELILQSYLFAGFPRALNGMREWRRASGRPAPRADEGTDLASVEEWRRRGEETCATVYGPFYEKLRPNIAELHPALDAWMIVEGYGKVLSRPALDLRRRELCIVAACAAARQDRQLHSHLHGALHAGASHDEVTATLAAVAGLVGEDDRRRYDALWARVRGK
jgi:4-carboxymuconolactone decarboxylase